MPLNLNVSPYYDDFDASNNYYRILYKPGYAVQGRELIQSQTILQDQIQKFATNIFAQNTPISGGQVTTHTDCHYIKVYDSFAGISTDVTSWVGKTIKDQTGTILAKVLAAVPATSGLPQTIIVSYISGMHFPDGAEIFDMLGLLNPIQAYSTLSSGGSSVVSVAQGVYYVASTYKNKSGTDVTNGVFVQVNPQTIILSTYSNKPTLRVGLNIVESIQNSYGDTTLLDPAIGASNFQAPGADRYQIKLILSTLPITLGNDQDFIELVRITNGVVVQVDNETQYATLDNYLAERTFETNGDFVVEDFHLSVANTAVLPSSHYTLKIGKGVAYVRGYRLENQSDLSISNDRAQTTSTTKNNKTYVDYGQYFYVNTVNGLFDVTTRPKVDLHVVNASNVITTNTNTYNSTLVGSGYITNLVYDHNTSDASTNSYVYRAYVNSIKTTPLSANVATSAYNSMNTIVFPTLSGNTIFSNIANAYFGTTVSIVSGPSTGDSRTIVSYNASTRAATVNSPFTRQPTSNSIFTLQFDVGDVNSVVIANTTHQKILSSANIDIEGKLGGSSTNKTFYESPDAPELIYNLGQPYVQSLVNSSYLSTAMFRHVAFSGGTLTVSIPLSDVGVIGFEGSGNLSKSAIKQNYTAFVVETGYSANTGSVGSIVDLSDHATVEVSGINNSILTIKDINGRFTSNTLVVSIIANVNIFDAYNTQHVLKTKTHISGNTTSNTVISSGTTVNSNTFVDLVNAQVYIKNSELVGIGNPQSLFVSDVKKLVKVIDSLSPLLPVTVNMMTSDMNDITSSFILDNGQRDCVYKHANITQISGKATPKGNILVVFDYYSHNHGSAGSSGDGYFSYESYENSGESYIKLPSYTSDRGTKYNLRDCLDFRPAEISGQSNYAIGTTGNPTADNTGTYIPQNLTDFTCDYSYYLGRFDKLVLSKDKNFRIIQGNPSLNPTLPSDPDGCLVIANLYNDPYTAYLPSDTPVGSLSNMSIQKVKHRRWRMQDISDLEFRLDNNGAAASMSPSEMIATTILIPDVNGIPRVKNAVIVDNFNSYGVCDTLNQNFTASIDTLKNRFGAPHFVSNYTLQSRDGFNSLQQLSSGDADALGYATSSMSKASTYYCLPYTQLPLITQQLASQFINVNPFSVPIYRGICSIYPPLDNWVDTNLAPDLLLANIDNLVQSSTLNATNVNNFQSIPGTQMPIQTANNTSLVSSYTLNNGYITNNTIQPYIRPQQLIIRAKNLKVNTPVGCYFDGINVNSNMVSPNTIELNNVRGIFEEDDVIGIYSTTDNKFYPIAVIAYIYQYPSSNNFRLYVTSDFNTNYNDLTKGETINMYLSNAKFDINGNYTSNTAYGEITNSNIITGVNSGYISGVGSSLINSDGNAVPGLYNTATSSYGAFSKQYGSWDKPTTSGLGGSGVFTHEYPLTITTAGTYYFATQGDDSIKIYLDSILKISAIDEGQQVHMYSQYLTVGTYTIKVVNDNNPDGDGFVACAVSTAPWNTIAGTTTGVVVWSTRTPWRGSNPPSTMIGTGTLSMIPGGGSYYTGATSIIINPLTSNTTNLLGCTINLQTNRVTEINTASQITSTSRPTNDDYDNDTDDAVRTTTTTVYTVQTNINIENFSSTITSYDANTRIAVLSTPVNVSIGINTAYGNLDSKYSIIGTQTNYKIAESVGGVSTLCTNENGTYCGIFNIPESTFTTGKKVFRIDNRDTVTDATTATTYAEGTFYGSSLSSTNIGNPNFSPSVVASSQVIISTAAAPTSIVNPSTLTSLLDPVAQTFSIDGISNPNGVFLHSVDLFFKSKATTTESPITISIVGTTNGVPKGSTLHNSIVTLNPNMINVSNTPSVGTTSTTTRFKFDSPVYIQPTLTYAILIHSNSTEYELYVASQNDIAYASTTTSNTSISKITSVPYTGSLFETQNSIDWIGIRTKSLMFAINRCKFDISKNPKIPFIIPIGAKERKSVLEDIKNYYVTPTLSTNLDIEMSEFNVTTTDFIPTNTNIRYSYQATLGSTGQLHTELPVVPGRLAAPNFDNESLSDGHGPRVIKSNDANSFILYASLSSTDDSMSPIISDDGTSLYNIQYGINNLPMRNDLITLLYGGAGYNAATTTATVSAPDIIGGTQASTTVIVSNNIVTNIVLDNPGSGYLNTPIITVSDANTIPGTGAAVFVSSEFSPTGGNAATRYVSKEISLSNTNNSGDLRAYITAYRPSGTDIYVFYKIQNSNDSQRFTNANWQLMTYINNSYTHSSNMSQMVNLQLAPGTNGVADNHVSYLSTSTGLTYSTFNSLSFKIVLATSDTTLLPHINNLSVVALPAGN